MAEPERLEPMKPPFSLLRRQLPSREAKCGTKMVSIILCAPTVGCVTSLCPPQTPNSSLLTSTAIPHNSKCRYGERGAADAKPKAQIILDAAKVSAASGGNSEPKQGQRSQSARGFCPRSTMRVPQPDIIEHFGNADAVPQLPERCLSRKAGIVRCCPRYRFLSRAPQLVRWPMQFAGCSRRCGHPHPALRPQNTGRGTACSAWFWGQPLWYPRRQP